jgi:hypothetical protein
MFRFCIYRNVIASDSYCIGNIGTIIASNGYRLSRLSHLTAVALGTSELISFLIINSIKGGQ